MMGPPSGTRIWLAAGMTDMRRGFDGLASIAQETLGADPFSGQPNLLRPDHFRTSRNHCAQIAACDAGQAM